MLALRLLGPTWRYELSWEEGGPENGYISPCVYCFWHRCILPAVYFYRHRQIGVMVSRSFDGEIIARIIERFGFRPVRGSSSRGAVGALVGMHREIRAGYAVAFTADGPRGPVFVAKPGPVLVARNSQQPISCFHLQPARKWELPSWDRFMVPKPFSRIFLRHSKLIRVPADAGEQETDRYHAEMQASLERVRLHAEEAAARI